jgi:hypothetical protein
MPFQSNFDEYPDYDPKTVSKLVEDQLEKRRKILKLVRKYRKAQRRDTADMIYEEISLLLSRL